MTKEEKLTQEERDIVTKVMTEYTGLMRKFHGNELELDPKNPNKHVGKTVDFPFPKEEKIIPPFIGESIERSKRRKQKIDEIIQELKEVWDGKDPMEINPHLVFERVHRNIQKLERFKEEEL